MDDLFIEWKNGGVTATNVNKRLVDSDLPSFNNKIENGYFEDPVSLEPITSPDKKMASILIGNTIFLPNTLKGLVNEKIAENHLDMPNTPDKDEFAIMLEPTLVHPITRERFTREQLDEIYEKIFTGKDHEHLQDFPRPDRRSRRGGMKPIRRKKTRRKKTRRKKTRRKKTTHRKKKRRATKRR